MAPRTKKAKTLMLEPEGLVPTKSKDQADFIEKIAETSIGQLLFDTDVAFPVLQGGLVWIDYKMKLREKLFCHALASSMDIKAAAKAVKIDVAGAEIMVRKVDVRNYISNLLEAKLDDRARSPEEIRSKIVMVHDAVLQGKITHHQAAQALKALELYAKTTGMMVIEQEKEKTSAPLGFSPG